MKSLLISQHYFPPQVGGISHLMAAIARTLGEQDTVCLTAVRADADIGQSDAGMRVYRRPAVFAKSTVTQAVAWGMTVAQIMLLERPRVIQLATANEGYLGLWCKKWLQMPFALYAHGNEILAAMRTKWQAPQLALQKADRVIAVSRYTAGLVEQVRGTADGIEVIHPGCDSDFYRPVADDSDLRERLLSGVAHGKVILTVGGLVARKGHDVVIRALPRIRQRVPGAIYLIAGAGPNRQVLEKLAAETGVRDSVIFAGRIRDEELPALYSLADVFIMASRANPEGCDVEGFGLVFLEASACMKPVVGGKAGGVPDAIVEGKTGFLVDPDDPEQIAQVLTAILENEALARALGAAGRERVVVEFNWRRVGERIQNILESIALRRSDAGSSMNRTTHG